MQQKQFDIIRRWPKEVSGSYNAIHNNLNSLRGCPKELRSLYLSYNNLEHFMNGPDKIKETLVIKNNPLLDNESTIKRIADTYGLEYYDGSFKRLWNKY